MFIYILGILILSVFVGLGSGMFGLGGSGIIAPVLLFLLTRIGFEKSELMFMAMGIFFATMIISTSTYADKQYKNKNSDFNRIKLFIPSLILSIFVVSKIVTSVNQNFLNIGIGIIATTGGVFSVGLIVPFFNKSGMGIKKAIGTSAFCGIFLTVFASIGFIISGLSYTNLPAYSLGFVHIPTVLLISAVSVPMSQIGVKLMLKLSDDSIKKYFALFLITLSLYMIYMSISSLLF